MLPGTITGINNHSQWQKITGKKNFSMTIQTNVDLEGKQKYSIKIPEKQIVRLMSS